MSLEVEVELPTTQSRFVDKGVILFIRRKGEHGAYLNWFSVASRQLGSHAVVLFEGHDTGMGSWICMKDTESTCQHILLAQDEMRDILGVDGSHIEEWQRMDDGQGTHVFRL